MSICQSPHSDAPNAITEEAWFSLISSSDARFTPEQPRNPNLANLILIQGQSVEGARRTPRHNQVQRGCPHGERPKTNSQQSSRTRLSNETLLSHSSPETKGWCCDILAKSCNSSPAHGSQAAVKYVTGKSSIHSKPLFNLFNGLSAE